MNSKTNIQDLKYNIKEYCEKRDWAQELPREEEIDENNNDGGD